VDLLCGAVIIVMALDHVRDFSTRGNERIAPDLATTRNALASADHRSHRMVRDARRTASFLWRAGCLKSRDVSDSSQRLCQRPASEWVRLVSGSYILFPRFCGCFSPEKLFQMRIIECDDGSVAIQREVMGSRINEVCLSAN
jgi:hypothetical protein